MKVIKDLAGDKYKLTISRIVEVGLFQRYVKLKDLKENLPEIGHRTTNNYGHYPEILYERCGDVGTTWIKVSHDGLLSIGCKNFGATASNSIYKALGVKHKAQMSFL